MSLSYNIINLHFLFLLATAFPVSAVLETNFTANVTTVAANASSIPLTNDTAVATPTNISITDLAPMLASNVSENIANVVTPIQRHVARNWVEVISLTNFDAILGEDPNKAGSSTEVDPFRFTLSPSSAPSSLPSTHPSLGPTSFPTPRPTIWREISEPRNADDSYFDYNPQKNSKYGPGQKKIYEVKKDGSTKIIYENNNWEKVRDSQEETYWKPLQKDIKFDLSKNSCGSKGSRFQSPIDIWPTDDAECEEHHQIRHRPGDFRIDGDMIQKEILPSKLRLVFPTREGEEPDPPFAVSDSLYISFSSELIVATYKGWMSRRLCHIVSN